MIVLGSTGSIGRNSLELARKFGIKVEALSCNKNYKLLNAQIAEFRPKFVCIGDENLKNLITHDKVFCGTDGILEMLEMCESKFVINALVGFAGLCPSIKTQSLGKTLALANKESLVVGGKFLKTKEIRAIDSEHFGLKFLLENPTKVANLIITASGGAFYKTPVKALNSVTPQMALKHPNWDMGAKITIDSATMANKLFEIIEAYHLYGIKSVEAVIERTSMVHALINFIDGSTTAHLSRADMKLAIAWAICGRVKEQILKPLNLCELAKIKFKKISLKKYPIFSLKDELLNNPDLGVIINASNEIGVENFLNSRCKFTDISKIVFKSLDKFGEVKPNSVQELCEIDKKVREFAKNELKGN